jgi:hypothetical protein
MFEAVDKQLGINKNPQGSGKSLGAYVFLK